MGLSHCVYVIDFSLKLFKLLVQNVKSVFRLLFSEISENLLGIFVKIPCKVLDCEADELPTHIAWSMAHSKIPTYHLVCLVREERLEVLQSTRKQPSPFTIRISLCLYADVISETRYVKVFQHLKSQPLK